jgi:aspartate/methionine/tyrosine aminotransferase
VRAFIHFYDGGVTPSDHYSTRGKIAPFHVMEMMNLAAEHERAGNRVLHLEVGQPSTAAPPSVLAAAKQALETDVLGYTGALGLQELRSRISRWYADRYDLEIDPGRVAVTTGASGSCVLAFLALWDPGQRVGVVEPGYPCYRNDLQAFGVETVPLPVDGSTDFRLTIDHLEQAGPLDGLILATPSNPTGVVLGEDHLRPLLAWAGEHNVHVVVDEIYQGLTYESDPPTALEIDDDVVVINSFSKYFSMTGWRLGWLVAPEPLIPAIERLAQNLTISAPTLAQIAGFHAFEAVDECEVNVDRYRRNRDSMLRSLRRAGFTELAPAEGAFYIWVDVSHIGLSATEICHRWLAELDIAATPGIDFDPVRGEQYIRLSVAGSEVDIGDAGSRIIRWASHNNPATDLDEGNR